VRAVRRASTTATPRDAPEPQIATAVRLLEAGDERHRLLADRQLAALTALLTIDERTTSCRSTESSKKSTTS
jgi:hypothetical protein